MVNSQEDTKNRGTAEIIKLKDAEELAPVNPSGVEIGEEISLDELRPYFKSFYRTKPYVSIIGGLCTQGRTKGDIDIFIRSEHRDIATEFRIIRMFPEKYWFRFQFHYPYEETDHPGVYTNYLDIYDEKIEVVSAPELILMSMPQEVRLFKFAKLLKPAHGHYKGEEYSIEKLIEVVNAKPEWYEDGIYVQKKFDGVHVRADHSKDGKVVIWTEEGNDITGKLPTLVAAIKRGCSKHDVVFVGELEFWENEKHQSRQQTTAVIHTKELHPNEHGVKLNFFDVLLYDEDVHSESYAERLKCVERLRESPQLRKAKYSLVRTPTELRREVEHYASQPGSEGAYLKRADFPYELDGKTLLNLKYKNTFSWDVGVRRIDKIKGANAWSYLCIIEGEKGEAIPCGKTYNCSIGRTDAEPLRENDILKVEFVNLNKYVDPKTKVVWYNMWSPRPLMWREDKKRSDNVRTAEKLVKASHGTVSEKPFPKRYLDAKDLPMYPDESKKWKGMCHSHIRGKSVHLDFRVQVSKDYLVGWTLYIPKGLSKDPETFAEAKALNEKEIMPIVREKLSDPLLKFNCKKKAPEPIEWASYEGTVQPGEIGATKKEHGHFIIIDSFEVAFGAQKPHFHEYFCDGELFNGRVVFTLLENKKEWEKTDEGLMTWMASIAKESPTPYVLSNRAKDKKWIPPYTFSALPAKIRTKVPKDLRYWEHKNLSERLGLRDELVQQIKKRLLELDAIGPAQFRFIKQTWKGQKVVRGGPSRTVYYFIIFQRSEGKEVFSLAMLDDITKKNESTGLEVPRLGGALKVIEKGDVPSKSVLNPAVATPSKIEILDEGPASILSMTGFRRYKLEGKKIKRIWIAFRQDKESKMWIFKQIADHV